MTFKMRVAILSLLTTLFFAIGKLARSLSLSTSTRVSRSSKAFQNTKGLPLPLPDSPPSPPGSPVSLLAQFFPLSLYSVTSLTTLTKRTLVSYTPVLFTSSSASNDVSAFDNDDGSATFLPDIIQASQGTSCTNKCGIVSRSLAGCLRSGADYDILKCSCSDAVLARVYTCANCITLDETNQNGTLPLQNYNAFVNQCISLSLSNSSQLHQIKGQPLTIANPTTTLTNPSATIGASGAEVTDESEYEDGEEEEEGEKEGMSSSAGTLAVRGVGGIVAVGIAVSLVL
ncbi:hypothetical protein JCM16303_005883 [Sporobolomyces ruberrimus]